MNLVGHFFELCVFSFSSDLGSDYLKSFEPIKALQIILSPYFLLFHDGWQNTSKQRKNDPFFFEILSMKEFTL